jgi:transcriptional regulator with XRE-family HTH domain
MLVYAFDSNRIRTLREAHKMTLEEMAEKLGKVKQQVSIWECGVNVPSLDNLIHICNTFDVPISFFVYEVTGTIENNPSN